MPVFVVEIMLLEVTLCVMVDYTTPEGTSGWIFIDLTYLPVTWELVEYKPGYMFTNTLTAILTHDEKLSYHPGIFKSGQVIVPCNQNKTCQITVHPHQEGGALWLNPIVVEIWIIEETHWTDVSVIKLAEIILVQFHKMAQNGAFIHCRGSYFDVHVG